MINNRKLILSAIATALVVVPTLYYIRIIKNNESAVDSILAKIGFYPVRPPSTLVGPGSIYRVSRDGKFYTIACRADDNLVKSNIVQSLSEETIAQELQDGRYTLDAKLTEIINATIGSDSVQTVSYSLKDVNVVEIPLDRNDEIFVRLTSKDSCHRAVDRLLENKELVCQGQSVLLGTVDYNVETKSGIDIDEQIQTNNAVQKAIETTLKVSVKNDNGRFVSGVGLHYGIKVNPMCITRPGVDKYARIVPWNLWDRFVNFVRIDVLGG